jgi:cytochrome d ubiquinol oxidase subunit I
VSPNVDAGQVLFSIVLFGLIYFFLFLIWIFILDSKIRKGPVYATGVPPGGAAGSFLDVASETADRSGLSMTGAHDRDFDGTQEGEED